MRQLLLIMTTSILACNSVKESKDTINASPGKGDVMYIGEMSSVIHNNELQGTIKLDTLKKFEHLYGVGPIEYLTGEIIAVDGKIYTSKVVNDTNVSVEENANVKAPFFVYADVDKWHEVTIPKVINTMQDLEEYLGSFNYDKPFVFRVKAKVEAAKYHIVNLPAGAAVHSHEDAHKGQKDYNINNVDVELVGFFSKEHHGVFTHRDSYMHIHLISDDKKHMGHLDEVVIKNNGKLFLSFKK